jgi:Ras-related protein Rab-1A
LLAGDVGSGRSCFLLRFTDGTFTESYISTIGIDFKIKSIKSTESNKTVKLQIWDAAGRERFRQITSSYYRGAAGVFFMFDVTDRTSFQSVKRYFDDSAVYCIEHVQRILVATKLDLNEKRAVSYEEAKEFAAHLGIPYIETSAKDNMNIDEAVNVLAKNVEANWDQIQLDMSSRRLPAQPKAVSPNNRRCILI